MAVLSADKKRDLRYLRRRKRLVVEGKPRISRREYVKNGTKPSPKFSLVFDFFLHVII